MTEKLSHTTGYRDAISGGVSDELSVTHSPETTASKYSCLSGLGSTPYNVGNRAPHPRSSLG